MPSGRLSDLSWRFLSEIAGGGFFEGGLNAGKPGLHEMGVRTGIAVHERAADRFELEGLAPFRACLAGSSVRDRTLKRRLGTVPRASDGRK